MNLNLNLDEIISELTSSAQVQQSGQSLDSLYNNLIPMEAECDDTVPEDIQIIMNNAMEKEGSLVTFQKLLAPQSDDESAALEEMDAQLGPDAQDELFKNMPNFNRSRKAKRIKKAKRAYPELPDHLNHLMQRANLLYVQGNNDESIEMLRTVIQERADAHEAWLTLGMIYNSTGDLNRALQCRMMAAHLNPGNADLWASLGLTSKYISL